MSFSSKDKFQNENDLAKILLFKSSFLQNPAITQNHRITYSVMSKQYKATHKARCFYEGIWAIEC